MGGEIMRENLTTYIRRSALIAFVLIAILFFPVTAHAKLKAGACGKAILWLYNTDTKTLTIAGTGEMYDYSLTSRPPWYYMNTDNSDDDFDYTRIENVVFGSTGITHIGDYAFHGLYLSKVTFPNTLESIGKGAFEECESLTVTTLPSKVKTIGESAFSSVYIPHMTLPAACTTIGKYAFSGHTLNSIYIPSTVKSVGKYAFGYYAYGWDDFYVLDDFATKKHIRKNKSFIVYGPATAVSSSAAFKYAKAWDLPYCMKGVKGTEIKRAKNVKTRRIQIKWKKNKKASGYQIRYSRSAKFLSGNKYITINNKKTTQKKTAKLKKKKTYYISIRYFKKINGKKCYSEWGKTRMVKIKK